MRRCLGSRADSGGRRRDGGLLRREGGPRARLRAPGRFRRSVCAEPSGGLWLAGSVRSAHPRAVPGSRVSVRAWVLCASRPDPRFQAGDAGGRVGACFPGRLENLLKQREEASQVFVWFISPPRTGARLGCASRPLHCCGRGWGRGCLRCRVPARPLGKVHSFISSREYFLASSKRSPYLPKGSEFGKKSFGMKIPVYFVSFSCT